MSSQSASHDWRKTLLKLGSTIQQGILSLEASGLQIVLVTLDDEKLCGTLTDGDIRRALLKGYRLDSLIDEIVSRNPLVVPPEISRDVVLQLMKINRIHQLPIVDQQGLVIGLHVWDSVIAPASLENMMLIMAGGKGTRMGSHTKNCPKPMLEVGGKPILEHILERAISNGFHNFLISVHYLGHIIENYFGDGRKFGVNIEYLRERVPLGTAGCLGLITKIPELPFIVTNGDVLTDIQYDEFLKFHIRHEADATMAVRQYEIQNQFGVVQIKGIDIEGFEEKPIYRSHVNAGTYVISPKVFNYIGREEHCDMPILFHRIKSGGGRTIVYPMHESWLDVGRPDDLREARSL